MANEFIARKGIIALADSTISGSLSVTGTLTGDGSGLTGVIAVQSPGGSNGQIQYNDGGSTGGASSFYYNDVDGRVGIGTSTPASRLHVYGGRLVIDNVANAQSAIQINSAGGEKIVIYRPSNSDDLRIYTPGAGDAFTLSQAGAVGINDTNPGGFSSLNAKLVVGGNQVINNNSPILYLRNNSSGNDSDFRFSSALRFTNGAGTEFVKFAYDGNVGIGTTTPGGILDVDGTYGDLKIGDPSVGSVITYYDTTRILLNSNHIMFYTSNLSERMRISSDGNVGIGTTNPIYKLHVQGNGINISGSGAYLRWNSGDMQIKNEGSYKMGFHTYNTTAAALVNRMVIDTDGNVGINTTTPTAKLQVQSDTADSTVFAVDGVNGRLFSIDDSLSDSLFSVNTIAGLPVIEAFADNTVVMGAYGTDNLYVSGSKVGINTDSPDEILHIHNPAATAGQSFAAFTNTNSGLTQEFLVGINQYEEGLIWNENNKSLIFATNNGERMRILNTGNVGIGTSSPGYKLEVAGTFRASGASSVGGTFSSSDITVTAGGNGNAGLKINRASSSGRSQMMLADEAGNQIWRFGLTGGGSSNFSFFDGTQNALTFEQNGDVYFTNNGNVGIGTSSPADNLTIYADLQPILSLRDNGVNSAYGGYLKGYGLAGSGGQMGIGVIDANIYREGIHISEQLTSIIFKTNSSETERMRINNSGNVGIGTNTPQAVGAAWTTLEVQGQSTGGGGIIYTANNGASVKSHFYSDGNGGYIGTQTNHYFAFTSGNAERMRITSAGKVGIGTTNPDGPLHVVGSSGNVTKIYYDLLLYNTISFTDTNWNIQSRIAGVSSDMRFYTNGTTETMRINASGNVGINTTAPTQKLDVAGHAVIGQSGGAYKYFIKRPSDASPTVYFGYHSADNGDFGISNASGGGNIRFESNNGALRFRNTSNSTTLFNVANNGNTTVSGDLTVGGTITAQEFRAEFITNTIILESGSTQFGDSADDTHTFTGSMKLRVPGTAAQSGNQGYFGNLVLDGDAGQWNRLRFDENGESIWGVANNPDGKFVISRLASAYSGTPDDDNFVIDTNGRIGIGTASPSQALHVNGNTRSTNFYVDNAIYHDGDTDTYIWFTDNRIRIDVGGVNKFDSNNTYLTTTGKAADSELLDGLNSTSFLRSDTDDTFSGDLLVAATTNTNATTKVEMRDNAVFGIKPNSQNSGTLHFAQVDSGNSIGMQFTNGAGTADWDISMQPFGGRVGIGTVSPDYMFTVAGSNGNFGVGSTGNDLYFTRDSANYFYATGASSSFRFFTAGVEKLNLGNTNSYFPNGNVGIGTTSPGDPLHISTSGNDKFIRIENSSAYTGLWLNDSGANNGWLVLSGYTDTTSPGDFAIREWGVQTSLTIKQTTGNVGIGTTAPAFKLDVSGSTRIQGADSNSTISDYGIFAIENQQREGIGFGYDADGNTAWIYAREVGIGSRALNVNGSVFIANYGGNVGIGTNSPGYKLDVNGGIRATGVTGTNVLDLVAPSSYIRLQANANNIFHDAGGNHYFRTAGGASTSMIVTSGGQVGIGTTSPGAMLDVAGQASIDADLFIGADGGANYTASRLRLYSHDNYRGAGMHMTGVDSNWFIGTPYTDFAGSFIIARKGVATAEEDTAQLSNALFTLRSSGNVGIGTTNPAERLDVAGAIKLSTQVANVVTNGIAHHTNGYMYFTGGAGGAAMGNDSYSSAVYAVDNGSLELYAGSSNRLHITSGGNVGIGITSPTRVLDVNGDSNFRNTMYFGSSIGYLSWGGSVQRFVVSSLGSYNLGLATDSGTDRVTIQASTGNVGIGTQTPNSKLEVYGSGGTVLDIQGSQGQLFSVSDSLTGSLMSVNDISGLPILEVFDTDKVVMGEYGTNALVVTGSNVGIGTDTPIAPLSILATSTGYSSDSQIKISDGSTAYYGGLSFDDTGSTRLSVRNSYDGTNSTIGFGFGGSSDKVQIINGTGLIVNEGNVGIGTTSPGSKLHVEGEIRADFNGTDGSTYMTGYGIEFERGTNYLRPRGADGTQTLHIGGADDSLDWNNVNIKTLSFTVRANGADRFQVGSDVAVVGSTDFNITGASRRLNFTSGTGTVRTTSNNALYLATNNTTRMTITGGGAVGIGTTSPTARFEVEGDGSYTSNIKFKQAGSQEHFLYAATNTQYNLIGSSSPVWAWGQQNGAERMRLDNTSLLPGANPGYYIGSDARRWEIVFCNILDSAGLHEKNLENPEGEKSVGDYATGTVLVWKGGKNVPCSVEADHMRMGIAVEGMASPLVQGAEPVLCTGVVNEGDYIITSDKEGHARGINRQEMLDQNLFDCVLGKALEQGEGESYLLKVWVTI